MINGQLKYKKIHSLLCCCTKDGIKSTNGGKTFISQRDINIETIFDQPEGAFLTSKEIFYVLDGKIRTINLRQFVQFEYWTLSRVMNSELFIN